VVKKVAYIKTQNTLYTLRRQPTLTRFFDSSRVKVGRHKLQNRLQMMDNIPWRERDLSDENIRTLLKEHFDFNFDRQ